jgi:hypothetical protein
MLDLSQPNIADQIRPMTEQERQMHEDLHWAMTNSELESRYRGQLVVVWHKQVIAHGTDEEALLQEAASPARPRAELVVIEFPDPFVDLPV